MTTSLDAAIPSALDCRKKIAEVESEKASDFTRKMAAAEAEKKALMDQLTKPSGVSDEERLKRAASIIKRAVDNGLSEVQVGRFQINSSPTRDAPSTSRKLAGNKRWLDSQRNCFIFGRNT